jgi:hypothetical protein
MFRKPARSNDEQNELCRRRRSKFLDQHKAYSFLQASSLTAAADSYANADADQTPMADIRGRGQYNLDWRYHDDEEIDDKLLVNKTRFEVESGVALCHQKKHGLTYSARPCCVATRLVDAFAGTTVAGTTTPAVAALPSPWQSQTLEGTSNGHRNQRLRGAPLFVASSSRWCSGLHLN